MTDGEGRHTFTEILESIQESRESKARAIHEALKAMLAISITHEFVDMLALLQMLRTLAEYCQSEWHDEEDKLPELASLQGAVDQGTTAMLRLVERLEENAAAEEYEAQFDDD